MCYSEYKIHDLFSHELIVSFGETRTRPINYSGLRRIRRVYSNYTYTMTFKCLILNLLLNYTTEFDVY